MLVEKVRRHRRRGGLSVVRVDVQLPGREIVATRDHEYTLVAVRDAFAAAIREVTAAAEEEGPADACEAQ